MDESETQKKFQTDPEFRAKLKYYANILNQMYSKVDFELNHTDIQFKKMLEMILKDNNHG